MGSLESSSSESMTSTVQSTDGDITPTAESYATTKASISESGTSAESDRRNIENLKKKEDFYCASFVKVVSEKLPIQSCLATVLYHSVFRLDGPKV